MTSASTAEIYPQYCFHLSPTIYEWCRLRASDIRALRSHPGFEGQDLFFFENHPIKWVRVAGVVVAIDEYPERRIITVDDSSGSNVECVVTLPAPAPPKAAAAGASAAGQVMAEAATETNQAGTTAVVNNTLGNISVVDIGVVIDVKGGLGIFRDQKRIKVEKIVQLRSTEQEMRFWVKANQFRRSILSKPWVLDREEVRRCRRQAEGLHKASRGKAKKRPAVENELLDDKSAKASGTGKNPFRKPRETGLERRARITNRFIQPEGNSRYDALGI